MLLAVVDGAMLQCSEGSTPCPLTVTNHRKVQADDKPAATVLDHAPGVNLRTFGTCKVTGSACTPVTPAPWLSGSTKKVQINDQLVLLATDKLMCTKPGVITIVDPMQTRNVKDA